MILFLLDGEIIMSWYDNWCNWLNTTIRVCSSNQNNVGYYYFKSNSNHDKAKYFFGRYNHYDNNMKWKQTHRGRRTLY